MEYFRIECEPTLEESVNKLLKFNEKIKNRKAKMCFNGRWLYSDTVTMDDAYLKITGMTKSEFDKMVSDTVDINAKRKREHESRIPELIEEWVEKGHKILDEKYWEIWDDCVPYRLMDLYQGMELGACLEIVEQLNSGCDMEHAKSIIDGQEHSGMSFSLVTAIVSVFCDRGENFVEYVS